MSQGDWHMPAIPDALEFTPWDALVSASFPQARGWYLARSKVVASLWGVESEPDPLRPWRASGVFYVGTSGSLQQRLRNLQGRILRPTSSAAHPGGDHYMRQTVPYLEQHLSERPGPDDVEVCWAISRYRPPDAPDWDEGGKRRKAAERAAREAVESAIVADTIAHRLATGCRWRLLNYIDRSTV